ncbi:expressed unknown protein [Seminavis robusta]|uniref:Uncharacterized protein n=1 Tax=Seminavis robusta TaxID=568900 RepID=A0A9N8ENJ5_9STRA|nr:expressed unknown protein [Seminavis robusta]|eukprot:Sro1531_g280190.1 n/a (241) ;mRNA; f:18718-19440
MDFTVGQDHTLTLRKMDDAAKSFRGFLFRLGPPPDEPDIDTTDALTRTTSNTTVAFDQCIMGEGVGGLGHTNALLKESVSGILRMERVARGMPLDVTVVIQNYGGLSEYYYQQFIINAVQGDTGPGGPVPPPRIPTFPPILTGGDFPPAVAPILPPNVAPILAPTTTQQQPPEEEPTVSEESPPIPQPVHQQKAAPDAKCGSLAAAGDRGGSAAQAKDCSRHSADGGGGFRRRKLKGSTY